MKKLLIILTILVSSGIASMAITPNDTLICIIKEPRERKPPLYTFISIYNIESNLEEEIGLNLAVDYMHNALSDSDSIKVNTSLGIVYGTVEIYCKQNTQVLNFYAYKYVWDNGEVLYIEDRRKF